MRPLRGLQETRVVLEKRLSGQIPDAVEEDDADDPGIQKAGMVGHDEHSLLPALQCFLSVGAVNSIPVSDAE